MNPTEPPKPAKKEKSGKTRTLKPSDIVRLIQKERPKVLRRLPDKSSAALIQAAFVELAKYINAMGEGIVRVRGIGSIRVRQVEREKDGKKVSVKRTILRAAQGKTKKKTKESE